MPHTSRGGSNRRRGHRPSFSAATIEAIEEMRGLIGDYDRWMYDGEGEAPTTNEFHMALDAIEESLVGRRCTLDGSYYDDVLEEHVFELSCGHEAITGTDAAPAYCPKCGAFVVRAM